MLLPSAGRAPGRLVEAGAEHCERACFADPANKVPFDMIEEWKERNEIEFRNKLSYMPEQFAEASQRYSSDPKDYLLASILRHCVTVRNKRPGNSVEKSRFMASVADSTYEVLDRLEACECGILLKCFLKLGHRDYALQRSLIDRMLQRGQIFSPYASISALNTLLESQSDHLTSQWQHNVEETSRLRRRLFAQIHSNLDKFSVVTLSRLANSLSRMSSDVRPLLSSIRDVLFERHIESSGSDGLWTEEVVHLFANGFSRKGILDKRLFDYLRNHIIDSCSGYNIDVLVSLCNAYSKFGSAEYSNYVELYSRLAEEIILQRRFLTSRHTCVVANAFAMCCVCHEHLLEVLDDTFVFNIDSYDSRQIAMMIHAFNKLGYRSRNYQFIWKKCTEQLESYSWQGLTMIFHAYTKGEIRDDATDTKFCNRFNHLFNLMEQNASGAQMSCTPASDLPQPTTYVSLVYSLVKGNIMQHTGLMAHLAKGCHANLSSYEPDEIANLTLAFARIYNYTSPQSPTCDEQVWRMSSSVLEAITKRLKEPTLKFTAFSMAKVIESLGDCGFSQSAQTVLLLIKRNILILDKLSYTHITGIIKALSTLGAHDEDVLSVLTSLKHNKNSRQQNANMPNNSADGDSIQL
ncbi:hypothetical protein X943_001295 [Babesia divergens]|uniref:RNA-editing substrate-binding complex 6 protein domain-containing protein n=1 Tax=Babesia divergens TaxID=32595 RepID=A0AAD9GD47_BABDI|nr:hypothetical protein X943_001295 [Babesia divergens]